MAVSDPLQLDALYVVWWQKSLPINQVNAEAATILVPYQLGVGVKLATEAAVHASRTYINNLASGQAVLKLDFNNAFNSYIVTLC